jgi:hypothetical protein
MPELTYRSSPSNEQDIIVVQGEHRDDEFNIPEIFIHEAEAIWRVDFPEMCSIPGCTYHVHLIGPASQPVTVPEPSVALGLAVLVGALALLRWARGS